MSHSKPLIAAAAATALVAMVGLTYAQSPSTTTQPAGAQTTAPSAKDRAAMEAAFAKADADHDGKLSKKELSAMPKVLARFDSLDKDKDGRLSQEEFMAAGSLS